VQAPFCSCTQIKFNYYFFDKLFLLSVKKFSLLSFHIGQEEESQQRIVPSQTSMEDEGQSIQKKFKKATTKFSTTYSIIRSSI
jgi:hypothetical protein